MELFLFASSLLFLFFLFSGDTIFFCHLLLGIQFSNSLQTHLHSNQISFYNLQAPALFLFPSHFFLEEFHNCVIIVPLVLKLHISFRLLSMWEWILLIKLHTQGLYSCFSSLKYCVNIWHYPLWKAKKKSSVSSVLQHGENKVKMYLYSLLRSQLHCFSTDIQLLLDKCYLMLSLLLILGRG